MKKKLHFFSKMLGIPAKVSRSQPSFTMPRTNTRVIEQKRNVEDDPALNTLVPTLTHSTEVLPEEAGHPQAERLDSPEHCQQGGSAHNHSMSTEHESNSHGYGQIASTSIPSTPQESSRSKSDVYELKDEQSTTGGLISAKRDQLPVPIYGDAAGLGAATAAIQTLRPAKPEQGVDGVASSSTNIQWRTSFHMVIHLDKGGTAMRVGCLDTGASVNVISIDVVESLKLPKVKYRGMSLVPVGEPFAPEWEVSFDWHVHKFRKTYTSTFAVVDESRSKGFDVLLGEKTVGEEGFLIPNSSVFFHTAGERVGLSDANDTAGRNPVSVSVALEEQAQRLMMKDVSGVHGGVKATAANTDSI